MSETIHVLWTEPHEEVSRTPYGDCPRFCFICRKRRDFERIVLAPVGMSYYGPFAEIRCPVCKTVDGDVFPGWGREWA